MKFMGMLNGTDIVKEVKRNILPFNKKILLSKHDYYITLAQL